MSQAGYETVKKLSRLLPMTAAVPRNAGQAFKTAISLMGYSLLIRPFERVERRMCCDWLSTNASNSKGPGQ